jgi:ribosome-associated protein
MQPRDTDNIDRILNAALDKKGADPVALDVHAVSSVTDWFVIVAATSDTHARAIADGIRESLEELGIEPIGVEGYNDGTWVLLDYGDVVVHVFHHQKRVQYALEDLWSDAPRRRV